MPDKKMTIAEMAAKVKQAIPALRDVPDDALVRRVLETRPDLINQLQTSEARRPLPQTTYLEDLENYMRQIGRERQSASLREAATAPVRKGAKGLESTYDPAQAAELQVAPLMVADLTKFIREALSPKNVAITAAMSNPYGRIAAAPYLMYQGGTSGAAAPYTGLYKGSRDIVTGQANVNPDELQDVLTRGAMFYGGAAGAAERAGAGVRTFRKVQQEAVGAGKEPVQKAREAEVEERTAYEERQAKARLAQQQALDKYNEELARWEQGQAGSAAKVAEAKREWMRKTEEAERAKLERAGRPAEKRGAERRVTDYAEDFQANAKRAEAQQRSGLNQRWNVFRKLTASAGLSRVQLHDLVELGREKLGGAPGDVKLYNDFMKEIGLEKDAETGELVPKEGKEGDLPLNTARIHSTAIGEKLAGGGLPGNVFQSLKFVKEGLEGDIEKVADQHGAGDYYRALKKDWATYMTDFRDVESPLANVIRADNPAAVEKIMLGDATRQNLTELAAKYQGLGKTANGVGGLTPTTVTAAGRLAQNISDLPSIRGARGSQQGMLLQSESPALEFTRSQGPKLRESTTKPPTAPVAKTPEKAPEVRTPTDIRRDILRSYSARPFRFWDLLPPIFAERLAMKSPAYREWIARQPRNELPVKGAAPVPMLPPPIGGQRFAIPVVRKPEDDPLGILE